MASSICSVLMFFFCFLSTDIPRADYSSGGNVLEQLLELPIDRREVSFLVSDEALDRCSIRGKYLVSTPSFYLSRVLNEIGSIFQV